MNKITKHKDGYNVEINYKGLVLGKIVTTKEEATVVRDNTTRIIDEMEYNNTEINLDNYYKEITK